MVKMICDICGKEFYSEFYEEGYIDHVLNFCGSHNRNITANREPKEIALEIMTDGNKMRSRHSINDRLKCFMLWDNVSYDKKEQVKEYVQKAMEKYDFAAEKAEQYIKKTNDIELFALFTGLSGKYNDCDGFRILYKIIHRI